MGEKPENYERFAKPPLVEAVVELRFQPREGEVPSVSFPMWEQLRSTFDGEPEVVLESRERPTKVGKSSVQLEKSVSTKTRFRDKAGRRAVTLAPEMMTVHAFPPGYSWSELLSDTEKCFRVFLDCGAPGGVASITLHVVNKIVLPTDEFAPGEYLQLPLFLPRGMPENITAFSSTWVSELPDRDGVARLVYAIPASLPGHPANLVLELTVGGSLSNPIPADWPRILEVLLKHKSRHREVFFGCLSDKVKELFR